MRIGIDISQLAHEKTGVAIFLRNLVDQMIQQDSKNEYILFYASLRRPFRSSFFSSLSEKKNVTVKTVKLPPILLDLLWNRLHIIPIEKFIGPIDVFVSSDWVQPPSKAKKITILYDLIVYKYPKETHNQTRFSFKNLRLVANIVSSQKKRLQWVKKEVDRIICISDATKKDAIEILGIPSEKLHVIYPGI